MKLFKLLFSRLGITAIMVVLEIVYLVSLLQWLSPYIGWITGILQIVSVFIILWIINQSRHLSADMMWEAGSGLGTVGSCCVLRFVFIQ